MSDYVQRFVGSNRGEPVTDDTPLAVKVVSGGGGGGGGTEYTQDAAAPTNPVAPAMQLRRTDAPASVGADGDWVTARATAKGELRVNDADAIAAIGALAQNIVLASGTSVIGRVGVDQTTPGDTNGVVMVSEAGDAIDFSFPSTGGRSSVAASTSNQTLLSANTARKGATFYNDSTVNLYIALGTTNASTTSFTHKVAGGGYYEVPFSFTGDVKGVWASATGNVRVTELT